MIRKDFLASSRRWRRKGLILKAIIVGVIFVAVVAGVVAFFRIPYFQVEKIEINGNNLINSDDLIKKIKTNLEGKYLGLFPKANIFLIPQNNILRKGRLRLRRRKRFCF